MVNHNQATVTEFMLCTWPQIRMVRLFLQLIEKMDQPRNVPPTELPQNIESSPQPPTHELEVSIFFKNSDKNVWFGWVGDNSSFFYAYLVNEGVRIKWNFFFLWLPCSSLT